MYLCILRHVTKQADSVRQTAFNCFKIAAILGDKEARFVCCEDDIFKQERDAQIKLLEDQLSNSNNNQDMISIEYELGILYYYDDRGKAVDYLKAAAQKGDPKAQYQLGVIHSLQGTHKTALKYFKKAAANGHPDAQKCLPNAQGKKNQPSESSAEYHYHLWKKQKENNYNMAMKNLKAAANQSHPEALNDICKKYLDFILTDNYMYNNTNFYKEFLPFYFLAASIGWRYAEETMIKKLCDIVKDSCMNFEKFMFIECFLATGKSKAVSLIDDTCLLHKLISCYQRFYLINQGFVGEKFLGEATRLLLHHGADYLKTNIAGLTPYETNPYYFSEQWRIKHDEKKCLVM